MDDRYRSIYIDTCVVCIDNIHTHIYTYDTCMNCNRHDIKTVWYSLRSRYRSTPILKRTRPITSPNFFTTCRHINKYRTLRRHAGCTYTLLILGIVIPWIVTLARCNDNFDLIGGCTWIGGCFLVSIRTSYHGRCC